MKIIISQNMHLKSWLLLPVEIYRATKMPFISNKKSSKLHTYRKQYLTETNQLAVDGPHIWKITGHVAHEVHSQKIFNSYSCNEHELEFWPLSGLVHTEIDIGPKESFERKINVVGRKKIVWACDVSVIYFWFSSIRTRKICTQATPKIKW